MADYEKNSIQEAKGDLKGSESESSGTIVIHEPTSLKHSLDDVNMTNRSSNGKRSRE